ncbi:MAG: phospholipase D-like domain-containing protein [Pseudomonadota bacterium]|nr:phospholipase D-like domain-containing protein [Pseudomonadota bacterium]HJO35435.1 phospholipase D-like domain-containing protein [Gammaproteobacteria bacterium]
MLSLHFWYSLAALFATGLALVLSAHAVIVKREPRAAVLWLVVIWLLPFGGSVIYLLLGINRIQRRAGTLGRPPLQTPTGSAASLPAQTAHAQLASLTGRITAQPLLAGNAVRVLVNGEAAYPAMLAAIDAAEHSIALATYIFGNDRVGRRFADALAAAQARGVAVRVLIDNAGERYSWPSMVGVLRRRGLQVARFLPRFPAGLLTINLRNHRKLLLCDGRIAFTGGMNIRVHHLQDSRRRATRDLHFELQGPVVAQLQAIFAQDWAFSAGEMLQGPGWFPPLTPSGQIHARAVADGPDEDLEKLMWTLHGALHSARESVRIMTPYFLPDRALVAALDTAALRGVAVEIVLPARNNLPYVHWAMLGQLWQVLHHGCRVYFTPGPFDHSKLMVVDRAWAFIGSANWDPRSLRLNFECNVECYDAALAGELHALIGSRIASGRRYRLSDSAARSLPVKLRDGLARLFMPYL